MHKCHWKDIASSFVASITHDFSPALSLCFGFFLHMHTSCARMCMLVAPPVTEYFRMPPIFKLDDYDRCFLTAPPHKEVRYCFTRSLIKPNTSSPIWNIIEVWAIYDLYSVYNLVHIISICYYLFSFVVSHCCLCILPSEYYRIETADGTKKKNKSRTNV